MLWIIIGIIIVLIIAFLLIVVHCAGKSISDEMQEKLDADQIKAVDEYIKRKGQRE